VRCLVECRRSLYFASLQTGCSTAQDSPQSHCFLEYPLESQLHQLFLDIKITNSNSGASKIWSEEKLGLWYWQYVRGPIMVFWDNFTHTQVINQQIKDKGNAVYLVISLSTVSQTRMEESGMASALLTTPLGVGERPSSHTSYFTLGKSPLYLLHGLCLRRSGHCLGEKNLRSYREVNTDRPARNCSQYVISNPAS
jgi:hypothetical protein